MTKDMYARGMAILKSDEGQGLVEYALILVLIAVVVIAGLRSVGTTTSSVFNNINSNLHP
jgi:pilus assembly protein Flp/PilA